MRRRGDRRRGRIESIKTQRVRFRTIHAAALHRRRSARSTAAARCVSGSAPSASAASRMRIEMLSSIITASDRRLGAALSERQHRPVEQRDDERSSSAADDAQRDPHRLCCGPRGDRPRRPAPPPARSARSSTAPPRRTPAPAMRVERDAELPLPREEAASRPRMISRRRCIDRRCESCYRFVMSETSSPGNTRHPTNASTAIMTLQPKSLPGRSLSAIGGS